MDMLTHGPNCWRHPVAGVIIGETGGTPAEQVRNYLYSLREATIQQRAGRPGDLSHEEHLALLRKLEQWEKEQTT
jgi:hypothetical protein